MASALHLPARVKALRFALGLGLALLCATCGAPGSQPRRSPELCRPAAAQAPLAAPDEAFDRLFTRSDDGWTGGDGTSSVLLPDGRTVWIFGDTFLGGVKPDRSRGPESRLVSNSFVLQDRQSLATLHGGSASEPAPLISPPEEGAWYWPAAGVVEEAELRVFLWKFRRTGPGAWDWAWTGTDAGSFSLSSLRFESLSRAPSENAVMYGSAVLEEGAYTYVYGTEDLKSAKFAHVARAARGRVLGPWEFYSGAGWSSDPGTSARILSGVANQYSVIRLGMQYLLITMDNAEAFGSEVIAYRSRDPWGPWLDRTPCYKAPEASAEIITYNAQAHPQHWDSSGLLVSYNVNILGGFEELMENADNYRPRFIRLNTCKLFGVASHGR